MNTPERAMWLIIGTVGGWIGNRYGIVDGVLAAVFIGWPVGTGLMQLLDRNNP